LRESDVKNIRGLTPDQEGEVDDIIGTGQSRRNAQVIAAGGSLPEIVIE